MNDLTIEVNGRSSFKNSLDGCLKLFTITKGKEMCMTFAIIIIK